MTGIPQFNYPAFKAAATRLRGMGFQVIDPTEIDDSHTQKIALASTDGKAPMPWGQLIGRDIAVLCGGANQVLLLPGWEKSRGSMMEALAAMYSDIQVSEVFTHEFTFEDIKDLHFYTLGDSITDMLVKRNTNVHQAHEQTLLQAGV